jgi:hypothetical protein
MNRLIPEALADLIDGAQKPFLPLPGPIEQLELSHRSLESGHAHPEQAYRPARLPVGLEQGACHGQDLRVEARRLRQARLPKNRREIGPSQLQSDRGTRQFNLPQPLTDLLYQLDEKCLKYGLGTNVPSKGSFRR